MGNAGGTEGSGREGGDPEAAKAGPVQAPQPASGLHGSGITGVGHGHHGPEVWTPLCPGLSCVTCLGVAPALWGPALQLCHAAVATGNVDQCHTEAVSGPSAACRGCVSGSPDLPWATQSFPSSQLCPRGSARTQRWALGQVAFESSHPACLEGPQRCDLPWQPRSPHTVRETPPKDGHIDVPSRGSSTPTRVRLRCLPVILIALS